METDLANKTNKPELIIMGDEVILRSEGISRGLTSGERDGLPVGLLEAMKDLYFRASDIGSQIESNRHKKDEPVSTKVEQEKTEEPEILTFMELLNKEFLAIPWDVEGIFESGTINMISAPPNQFKSWVVQHMAICMAQGKNVFGRFKTKTQNILIVNEEDNLRMLKDRSLKMIDGPKELGIHFMVMSGFKIDAASVVEICLQATKRNVKFIIFDSLRSIHSANENDSQEMQEIMDLFKELTKNGFTVLFTHHNRKKAPGKFKDESNEESRGSTAINAAVHGHISCEEVIREDGKYLIISQRKLKCDEKLKPFLVKVVVDKENNKMDFKYVGEYDSKDDTHRKNKDATLKIVENSDRWLSKKEIAEAVGIGPTAQAKILQELEKEKGIQSKSKKELAGMNIQVADSDAKHNAKFYFRKDKDELDHIMDSLDESDAV